MLTQVAINLSISNNRGPLASITTSLSVSADSVAIAGGLCGGGIFLFGAGGGRAGTSGIGTAERGAGDVCLRRFGAFPK